MRATPADTGKKMAPVQGAPRPYAGVVEILFDINGVGRIGNESHQGGKNWGA
jgi:hypothetical protein